MAAALLLGLLAACAGCLTPPVGPLTPAVAARVVQYSGSPMSGPTGQALVVDQHPEDVPSVSVTAVPLDRPVSDVGASLGSQARLIVSQVGEAAVQPSARLTQATHFLEGPTVTEPWGDLTGGHASVSMAGVIPSGVTAAFELTDPTPLDDPVTGQPVHRGITLELAEAAGEGASRRLLASLTIDDMVEPAPLAAPAQQVFRSEAALFDVAAPGDRAAIALFVPFRLRGTAMQTIAMLVQVSPGASDAAHRAAIARCQDDLTRPHAEIARPSRFTLSVGPNTASVTAALALMQVAGQRRAALVFLASQTGAVLSRDLLLAADDALLERLAAAVSVRFSGAQTDRAAPGWEVERAVLQEVVRTAANGPLPPEVTAVLTSHYGEAGRHEGSLDELSRRMTSPEEFEAGVVAENMIYLEDDAPGARVRALDWLQARQLAPAGYDPLGPANERRAALDRAEASARAAAPTGGQP